LKLPEKITKPQDSDASDKPLALIKKEANMDSETSKIEKVPSKLEKGDSKEEFTGKHLH
jgi:hypothetical protein